VSFLGPPCITARNLEALDSGAFLSLRLRHDLRRHFTLPTTMTMLGLQLSIDCSVRSCCKVLQLLCVA